MGGNGVLIVESHVVDGDRELFEREVLVEAADVTIAHSFVVLFLETEEFGGVVGSDCVGDERQVHGVGKDAANFFGFVGGGVF